MLWAGVATALLGGVLNASFQVPLRKDASKGVQIIGWAWENSWLVFTLCSVLVNVRSTANVQVFVIMITFV